MILNQLIEHEKEVDRLFPATTHFDIWVVVCIFYPKRQSKADCRLQITQFWLFLLKSCHISPERRPWPLNL
jgi:hypothetical protein